MVAVKNDPSGYAPQPAMPVTLQKHVERISNEQPKIGSAVKNLISIFAAGGNADFSKTEKQIGQEESESSSQPDRVWAMCELMAVGRAVSKAINAYEFVPSHEFGGKHPQGKDQSGDDRLDQLAQYNALSALVSQVISKEGKITVYLGKSAVRHMLLDSKNF